MLAGAARFQAMAAATREGVEPELAIAIDPLVPTDAFIDSLHARHVQFPCLSVSFSTEGGGGAERRLRRGEAALALWILLPGVPEDVVALPLLGIDLVPVVSADHPLAKLARPATISPGMSSSSYPIRLRRTDQAMACSDRAPGASSIWAAAWTSCWRAWDGAGCPSDWWRRTWLRAGSCRSPSTTIPPGQGAR